MEFFLTKSKPIAIYVTCLTISQCLAEHPENQFRNKV